MFFEKEVKEMERIVLLILIAMLLTGCGMGIEMGWYNLSDFVLPDDYEFLALIDELRTPFLIAEYMTENFKYKYSTLIAKSPYELWKIKVGDCNDFSLYGIFFAYCNEYETWQIRIFFDNSDIKHWLGVYKAKNQSLYEYTNNQNYGGNEKSSFEAIVNDHCEFSDSNWIKYEVYNYDLDIIEEKTQP